MRMIEEYESGPREYEGTIAFYLSTKPGEFPDLEIAASAAIHWAKGLKAAATALDPSAEYRVTLVAARPGSSNWVAKLEELRETVENSKINKVTKQVIDGWKKMPVVLRIAIGLAVVVPTTAAPTLDYWFGDDSFSDEQKKELQDAYRKA